MRTSRRALAAAALDLACGVALLAVAFTATRTLLASPARAYALVPLLSFTALALAFTRGRTEVRPVWLALVLLNLPFVVTLARFAPARQRALWLLAVAAAAASALGFATSRRRRLGLAAMVVANLALAPLVPAFVRLLAQREELAEAVPPFVLRPLESPALTSADLRGRLVVLDLWATWCVPCRRELPELDRLARQFADDPAVVFYAVDSARTDSPDDAGDTPAQARRYFAAAGYRLPLAWSGDGELEEALGVRGLPGLVVLDRAGRIRFRHVGFVGAEDLMGDLERLLRRLASEPSKGA